MDVRPAFTASGHDWSSRQPDASGAGMQLPLLEQQVASRVAGAASKSPLRWPPADSRAPPEQLRRRGSKGCVAGPGPTPPWRYRARGPDRAAAARNYCDRRAAAGVAVRAGEAFPTSTTVLDAATANLK